MLLGLVFQWQAAVVLHQLPSTDTESSVNSWGDVQGVGGSAVGGMRAKSGELHSIDLSGHQFHTLKCLFTDSDALDHTLYSSGILCGDIMSRCTVILDYPRTRMMFIPKDSAQ